MSASDFFVTDDNSFCAECGTLLPILNGIAGNSVTCDRCGVCIPVQCELFISDAAALFRLKPRGWHSRSCQ